MNGMHDKEYESKKYWKWVKFTYNTSRVVKRFEWEWYERDNERDSYPYENNNPTIQYQPKVLESDPNLLCVFLASRQCVKRKE